VTISKKNKEFLDKLIEYYINEAQSYREMVQEYSPKINSVVDTAFGLIIGCIYSSFLQAYSNQQQTPSSEDIQEFREIIMINARMIKDAIIQKNDSMLETG
jgi:mevalonate kinase